MKWRSVHSQVWLIIGSLAMFTPVTALGDGALVQLREGKGPFFVTIFVTPETLCGRRGDMSVLIQCQSNRKIILDADVTFALDPPVSLAKTSSDPFCGLSSAGAAVQFLDGRHVLSYPATRKQASNKLLFAAPVELNATGIWHLRVTVSRGPDRADFDCPISITSRLGSQPGLWLCLAFPPVAITAFALNQRLRRYSLEQNGLKPVPS